MDDHYEILGISEDATDEEIKKAFRKLVREAHPDKNPQARTEIVDKIRRARDKLLNPETRKAYDLGRSHRMKHRGEGVSQGRVHKDKDKKAGPGTFFKSQGASSKGAAGSWRSEYANKFAQDAKDKKETPNFASGNSQSNANQFSSGPEDKDNKGAPNFGDNNTRSSQYSFSYSRDAEDLKNDPNFAAGGDTGKKKYDFFSSQATKDEEGAANFGDNTRSSQYSFSYSRDAEDLKKDPNFAGDRGKKKYDFFSSQATKDEKETPNFGDNPRSSQYSFSYSRDGEDSKKDPNFAGDTGKKKYDFFSSQATKDEKETPNFEEHAQSSRNKFFSGPDSEGNREVPTNFADYLKRKRFDSSSRPDRGADEETSNFAEFAKKNAFKFPFNPDTKYEKKTPNFPGDAQGNPKTFVFGQDDKNKDFFNFAGAPRKEGDGFTSGPEPMDTDEDLPHKKPFGSSATASDGTGAGQSTPGANNKPGEPHVQEVFLTLEMVTKGCIKDMHFSRPKKLEDGTMGKEEMVLSFEVKPGWKAGTKVTFGKQVQTWKNPEQDIVFIMKDAIHPIFTRDGSNLLYTAYVSQAQVELGSPIGIPTLDGGKKLLVIEPEYVDHPELLKKIKGEGLPFPREPTKKGDLIVKFVSA